MTTQEADEIGDLECEVSRLCDVSVDLLAALEQLLADAEDLTCFQAYGLAYENEQHPLHSSIMKARAAIAKARGEQP